MSDRPLVSPERSTTDIETPSTIHAILVSLDGSEFAERALPVAARLARKLDADVHLFLFSAVSHPEEVRQREADLDALAGRYSRVHRSVVVDVDPARAIRGYVEGLDDAVLCMASHGRGRSAGIVGSVASEVIARSEDPLIIVGPRIDDVAATLWEGVSGSGVVACVDESPASAPVLPVALRWARLLREPTVLVTVAEPVPSPVTGVPTHRRFGPEGDVEAYLGSLVAATDVPDAHVTTYAIWDPISPAEGVRGYLREQPASLVVVGSRVRQGLARVVFGSVAAGIVHTIPSPVLVVPLPDVS
jgi:nucleotide-binding universal stress UspA family protein